MKTPVRPSSGLDRVPPPLLFLVSGFTQYYGAALAVGLFTVISAPSVAWWRLRRAQGRPWLFRLAPC